MRQSELILNNDGSIYHLNLLPGDVAETILLVGDPDRVSLVSKHFDVIEVRKAKREFVTHTGTLNGKHLSVISTGIGTSNIDIVLNEVDALFNIDLQARTIRTQLTQLSFIRIGTSGALQESIPVDTTVLSSHGLGLDALARMQTRSADSTGQLWLEELIAAGKSEDIDVAPAYIASADATLMDTFKGWTEPWVTVTCAGFYGLQGRSLRIPSNHVAVFELLRKFSVRGLQVGNLEMETAGIYLLADLLGHRAVSLSAILANRATGKFSSNPAAAVEGLIERTLRTLVELS